MNIDDTFKLLDKLCAEAMESEDPYEMENTLDIILKHINILKASGKMSAEQDESIDMILAQIRKLRKLLEDNNMLSDEP